MPQTKGVKEDGHAKVTRKLSLRQIKRLQKLLKNHLAWVSWWPVSRNTKPFVYQT